MLCRSGSLGEYSSTQGLWAASFLEEVHHIIWWERRGHTKPFSSAGMVEERVASAAALLCHALPFGGVDGQRMRQWLVHRTLPIQPTLLLVLFSKLLCVKGLRGRRKCSCCPRPAVWTGLPSMLPAVFVAVSWAVESCASNSGGFLFSLWSQREQSSSLCVFSPHFAYTWIPQWFQDGKRGCQTGRMKNSDSLLDIKSQPK